MSNLCEGSHIEEVLQLNNDHVVPKTLQFNDQYVKTVYSMFDTTTTYFCPNDIKFES